MITTKPVFARRYFSYNEGREIRGRLFELGPSQLDGSSHDIKAVSDALGLEVSRSIPDFQLPSLEMTHAV